MGWTIIESEAETTTEQIGRRLAARLAAGQVVAVYGDLGSGKTVLTRGIARGLGIADPVTSPTFAIVQEYPRPGKFWLYHLDLYRIRDADDAVAFGIEEYLFSPDALTVVEWPERIADLLLSPPRQRQRAAAPEVGGNKSVGKCRLWRAVEDATAESGLDDVESTVLVHVYLEHVAENVRRVRLPARLLPTWP